MALRCGFVSTYPPTQCGLATFTASLRSALLAGGGTDAPVVRLLERPEPAGRPEVVADLVAGEPDRLPTALDRLNRCDVVVLQHEFGVFGGPDGDEVLPLLDGLTAPSIVVLHTVLTAPSAHQRAVLEAVVARAGAVVTMTDTARRRLLAGYEVAADKVVVIAHGAPDPAPAGRTSPITPAPTTSSPITPAPITRSPITPAPAGRTVPTVLTWGLIGPGKGIEWAVEAMAHLRDIGPRYLVSGQTHPKVLEHQGETYRAGLARRIAELGLGGTVHLDPRYLDSPGLAAVVDAADVVLLPYDSTEQVTSGVLIEAVAAGKPVVATRFPHAVELLAGGAGILVPHRDPVALAAGLRRVLTDPAAAAGMARAAASAAPGLAWSAVADRYRELAERLAGTSTERAA